MLTIELILSVLSQVYWCCHRGLGLSLGLFLGVFRLKKLLFDCHFEQYMIF
jgi:hypothetical protein